MYCRKCGSEISDKAKFCPKCGSPITFPSNEVSDRSKDQTPDKQEEAREKHTLRYALTAILICAAAAVIVVISVVRLTPRDGTTETSVANNSNGTEITVSGEASAEESSDTESDADVEERPFGDSNLEANVSITDISVDRYSVDEDWMQEEGPLNVIYMTITNDNDISCEIMPSLKITYKNWSDGNGETKEGILMRSASRAWEGSYVYSPYHFYWYENDPKHTHNDSTYNYYSKDDFSGEDNYDPYLVSIGLAPHETKDICYYVYESNVDINGVLNDLQQEDEITEAELLDFAVDASMYTYVPVSECVDYCQVEKEDRGLYPEGSSMTAARLFLTGAVTNNTTDIWGTAYLRMDLTINGLPFEIVEGFGSFQSGCYSQIFEDVKPGDSAEIYDDENSNVGIYLGFPLGLRDTMLSYADRVEFDVVPTLLCYTTSAESWK